MKYYHPYELEQANNMLLTLIKEQILKGNLALTDINQELRIMFPNIYILQHLESVEKVLNYMQKICTY